MTKQYKLFLLLLTLVNLLQATFTELLPDEAYYYMYSTRLAFGYFDHPPMIALLIKIGEYFTHSEFGVRVVSILMNTATAHLLYKICRPQNVLLFIFSYLNFIAFQALGFLAVPDIPLLFFTACFFYCYQLFLENDSWRNVLLLALCAAALIYSKYHGFLVIGFVVLSNLRLLTKPKFYVIFFIASLLLLPHILWQINNEFPSIKYHLAYRFDGGISIENILGYIGGQLAFIGPVGVWMLLKSNYNFKQENPFNRAVIFTAIGFIIFFFVSSFNGRIEANWTAAAFIPFMILVSNAQANINVKVVKIGAIALIILMFPFRAYLVYDFLPKKINTIYQRHGWQQWANNVKQKANGAVVVFQDSYQKTAMYTFYANEFSHSVNSFGCRKSQYDLWTDNELKIQGKRALVVPNWTNDIWDSIPTPIEEKMSCFIVENYRSYTKLRFNSKSALYCTKQGKNTEVLLNVSGPDYVYKTIDNNPNLMALIGYRIYIFDKDSIRNYYSTSMLRDYLNSEKKYKPYSIDNHELKKGLYEIVFFARIGTTESGYSTPIKLVVE